MTIIESAPSVVRIKAMCKAEEIFNDYLWAKEFCDLGEKKQGLRFSLCYADGSIEGEFFGELDVVPFDDLVEALTHIRSDFAYRKIEYKGNGEYLIERELPFDRCEPTRKE